MDNNVEKVLDSISQNNVPRQSFEPPRHSWDVPPEKPDINCLTGMGVTDVVIVGAGLSGLSAALRCSQLGLSVAVVERSGSISARGGQIGVLRSSVMDKNGVFIDKERFVREWVKMAGSRCREELVWLFANRSGDAMDWLIDLLRSEGVETVLYGGQYKGPDYWEYPGTHMLSRTDSCTARPGLRSVPLAADILYRKAVELGAKFYFGFRAQQLEKEDGRVTSLIAQSSGSGFSRFSARLAVILATGDAAGDREMLEAYAPLGLKPRYCAYSPVGMNTGDGHKMGLAAGGVLEDGPWPLTIHLLPYALHTFFFLYVNQKGQRFMNEDTWVQARAIQCLNQPGDGDWVFTVFDSKWADELSATIDISGGQFCDSLTRRYGETWDRENAEKSVEHYIKRKVGFKADTLEELAEKMGVPCEALKSTVERYNSMALKGKDTDFGKRPALLTSIHTPPYYALKWGASLLNTNGGLIVDTRLNVLDRSQEPIDGLYAIGNVSGGLYGVDYPVLLNGNSHGRALTWGYVAAEAVAAKRETRSL